MNNHSIAHAPCVAQDYAAFAAEAQQAIAPALWRRLATQRRFDSPTSVGRRLVGAGYRARYGWSVVPAAFPHPHDDGTVGCSCWRGTTCLTPGKHPLGLHGRATLPDTPTLDWTVEALLDPAGVAGYDHEPIVNLALLTGQRSGGLLVADVGPRHAGDLDALWDAGWPQQTPIEQTGGGGWHVYTRWPLGGAVPNDPDYLPGVELKGDGLLVIAAPSFHVSGHLYTWLQGHAPWQTPLATLPEAVAQALLARATRATQTSTTHVRVTPAHAYDINDPAAHVYSDERTVELVTILLNAALRRTRSDHRNNVAWWLGRQLGTLGLTRDELVAVMTLYERRVRDDQ